jgi:cytochrome c-type biogenesis protein CcmF
VHAFASDPTRGTWILIYLLFVVGTSLTLFAVKAPKMTQGGGFDTTSRESFLMLNNLVLVVMCAMVLLGTLYPLGVEALGGEKLSVGAPYFGIMFAMLLFPLVAGVPLGVFSRFKRDRLGRIMQQLRWPLALAAVGGMVTLWQAPEAGALAAVGVAGAVWIMAATVAWVIKRLRGDGQKAGFTRAEASMTLAHFGLGIFMVGISLTDATSTEKHLRMAPGDSFDVAGYSFQFDGMRQVQGPNFLADEGAFTVTRNGRMVAELLPQKRRYLREGQVMTEAAIDPGLTRDIYVSLGEPLDNGAAWAVRLYHKPFVRWIWLGAIFMTLGGLLAASDKRYRVRRESEVRERTRQGPLIDSTDGKAVPA